MAEEQANLANKLAPLLADVRDADWQVGVVTTDPSESCLRGLIRRGDPDAEAKFAAAVNAGTNGSPNERGILQAVRSVRGDCSGQTWLRPDSAVAVLVVTDEDNCSYRGEECPDKPYATSKYLVDYLASIRHVGRSARVHGLIWHPSQSRAQCPTGFVDGSGREHKGYVWAEAIAQTAGVWGSICDADYSRTLRRISRDMRAMLEAAP